MGHICLGYWRVSFLPQDRAQLQHCSFVVSRMKMFCVPSPGYPCNRWMQTQPWCKAKSPDGSWQVGVSIAMALSVTWTWTVKVRKKWMAQLVPKHSKKFRRPCSVETWVTECTLLQERPAQKSLRLAISAATLNPEKIRTLLLRNQCTIPLCKDG